MAENGLEARSSRWQRHWSGKKNNKKYGNTPHCDTLLCAEVTLYEAAFWLYISSITGLQGLKKRFAYNELECNEFNIIVK